MGKAISGQDHVHALTLFLEFISEPPPPPNVLMRTPDFSVSKEASSHLMDTSQSQVLTQHDIMSWLQFICNKIFRY